MGENAISYSTCKKWFQGFREGNFDLEDDKRPSQQRKVKDEELDQLLKENFFQTQSELAETLETTQQVILKRLKKLGLIQKGGR